MAVPSFLLKKLYVKGSLKNTETGFEFVLKNNLAPGSLIGLGPLAIDDTTYPPDTITLSSAEGTWQGDRISGRNPLAFGLNVEVKIGVQGQPLAPGTYHITFSVMTREVGRIEFDLSDTID